MNFLPFCMRRTWKFSAVSDWNIKFQYAQSAESQKERYLYFILPHAEIHFSMQTSNISIITIYFRLNLMQNAAKKCPEIVSVTFKYAENILHPCAFCMWLNIEQFGLGQVRTISQSLCACNKTELSQFLSVSRNVNCLLFLSAISKNSGIYVKNVVDKTVHCNNVQSVPLIVAATVRVIFLWSRFFFFLLSKNGLFVRQTMDSPKHFLYLLTFNVQRSETYSK